MALPGVQEVRALSLLDGLATLTLAGNPLLERLGPRAVDVLVRNACPAVASLDGCELSKGGGRGGRKPAADTPSAEVHGFHAAAHGQQYASTHGRHREPVPCHQTLTLHATAATDSKVG